MEVKPGFKQTEVGVIPEEWALAPLVELIDESRSIRYGIVQPGKFDPAGRYMVRGQDYSTGWVAASELFRVSPQVEEPFKNARVKAGDVVITIVGASTGHIEVIPDWLDGANLTQTTARLAINPAKAFSGFCKCYLQSAAGQRQVANNLKGAAQPGLNCGDIEKFRIPLPPTLPEQRAIATALSDVDGLLGGLDRIIAKKRDLKQATMQQLLTSQTRLPGFHGEWEVKRLGDVAMLKNGYAFKSNTYTSLGTFKVITIANVQDGYMIADTCNTIASEPADLQPHQRLRRGDILISMTGNVGRVCRVDEDNCLLNQRVGKLVPVGVVEALLFVLLGQPSFISAMTGVAKGGAQPNLSASDIAEHTFNIPKDGAEQTAIAEVLTEMDAELAGMELRRGKTRSLKQAMMQELLTGRVRLIENG